jgi:hypothetical protein
VTKHSLQDEAKTAQKASSIWIHSMLAHQGGAARVANTLGQALAAQGHTVERSFELQDAGYPGRQVCLEELPDLLPEGTIPHVHTTADWAACLSALGKKSRFIVTLHDTKLLSGGCHDPFECLGCISGCPEKCPQGIADAHARQRLQTAHLRQLCLTMAAPSRWLLNMAQQRFAGMENIFLRLAPNGVDIPEGALAPGRESRAAGRRQWGISPKARLVVFSAHGGEAGLAKGGAHWQTIWQVIKSEYPDAVAVMAGGKAHSREGELIRVPYLERPALHSLLAAADLFLYPSLADNHPLAVLEALAAGTPVLAFSVGGIPEQIEPRKTGWLAPKNDLNAFCRSAVHILADPALLRTTGRQGYESWRQRFTLEHMRATYEDIYERLPS